MADDIATYASFIRIADSVEMDDQDIKIRLLQFMQAQFIEMLKEKHSGDAQKRFTIDEDF